MKNFEKDGVVIPYIHLNGDNRRDLIKQINKVYKLVEEARGDLWKLDMYNGRNAADGDHYIALREQRDVYFSKLNDVHEYLGKCLSQIRKKK